MVDAASADAVTAAIEAEGIRTWPVGTVSTAARAFEAADGFEQGAKGVDGGAVRLTGRYRD